MIKTCKESDHKLPEIGCVIMASGAGKRFGSNKLMADFHGAPMFLRALQSTDQLFRHRIVVTRHAGVAELCENKGVKVLLHNLPYRSDTIRLGLEALGDIDACMFLPADQPLIRRETISDLIETWKNNREHIVRPAFHKQPGSPVIFPAWTFPQLTSLPKGCGGNIVVKNHQSKLKMLPVLDPYELMDADTPETLMLLQNRHTQEGLE